MNTTFILNQIKDRLSKKGDINSDLNNICAICFNELDNLNWFGFYFVGEDGLYLNAFQGLAATSFIDFHAGVCGHTVDEKKCVIVEDVHEFPGHIACDMASNSEIVYPIIDKNGEVYCIIDVDSPLKNNFTKEHENLLAEICKLIVEKYNI